MRPNAAGLLERVEDELAGEERAGRAASASAFASLALCIDGERTQSDDSHDLFPAYSISKSFIAALLLSLCEEGALSLDSTLERGLPELPRAGEITLRQLLNHSGGLPDYGDLPAYHAAVRSTPREPWTPDEFARHTFAKGLAYPPGQGWAYSNPGYMLAVRLAERSAGASFDELLQSRILEPLELSSTSSPLELSDLAELVPATSTQLHPKGQPLQMKENYHPGWVAHRFVISRPEEIVRFYGGLFGGALIGEAWLAEMTTLTPVPHTHARIAKPAYGLGLMGDLGSPLGPILGHNGSGPAYSASAFHLPSLAGHRVTLCVMAVGDQPERAERLLFEALSQLERAL